MDQTAAASPRIAGLALAGLALAAVCHPLSVHAQRAEAVFAGSASYPPFEWRSGDGPRGFNIDLERAIAREGGRRPVHRLMEWDAALAALRSGRVDVVPMFKSQARAKHFRFTDPFYFVTHAIYGPPGTQGVTGPDALAGKRVALVRSGFAMQRLSDRDIPAKTVPVDSIGEALSAAADGRADVALVAQPTAERLVSDRGLGLKALGPPVWPRPYVFAVARGRPELFEWLSNSLRLVVVKGRYYDLYDRWKPELAWSRAGTAGHLRELGWVLGPILLLAAMGGVWTWQLRRRVAHRTSQLDAELVRRRAAEEDLRYWVSHDHLTLLPNRTEFVRNAQAAMEASSDDGGCAGSGLILTVRMVELDDLITAFGYTIGERLLERFGQRLQRQSCAAVGHFGRGVFGVTVPASVSPDEVIAELGEPLELEDLELDPDLVAGVARYPDNGDNVEELVRRAETAMAAAHHRRSDWLAYAAELEPDPEDRTIVRDFRRFDGQGLRAVFQPQIDLASMAPVSAEALVRWSHPDLGEISPARFVPLLEHAGTTRRLTEIMVAQAMEAARAFRQQGAPLVVSVNVSAVDLLENDLPGLVERKLAETGAAAGDLCVEMTETSVIEDPVRVRGVVEELRAMGLHSSIDDFGVGYSSLAYLSEFPVDEVKIDRSFVADMLSNERHALIVRSTISLAHALGLRVVAEGAEDQATVEALRAAGCDRVQGFVFARPMGLEAVMAEARTVYG